MIVNISAADLLKGQVITPNWYKAEVIGFDVKPSADNQSVNYIPYFKLETPDKDEVGGLGVLQFNSKLLSMMAPYLAAQENKPVSQFLKEIKEKAMKDPNFRLPLETEFQKGKKLQIKIENDTWDGRVVNRIKGFLPYDATVPF